ncbi:MAG: sugar phosphorylase [Opitutae bacterium]|nr:sugar phosphorylase [Opitutae bacterium]
MNPRIRQLLAAIYDGPAAADCAGRLAALLDGFRRAAGPAKTAATAAALTERDVLLITYADQVREPGAAPLAALDRFARAHLRGVISGIHLLPFHPWSSDDGFAVKDFFTVAPEYGTWDDIARLGGEFDLMFDAVFNHLSAESAWFRRFLAGDPVYRDFFVTVAGEPDLSAVIRPRALPLLTTFGTPGGPRRVWTTFSADQADLNFRNPAVLAAIVGALLFYVTQGARFIRLDAVAFLWKAPGTTCLHLPQTHRVIQLMRAVLDEVAPHTFLITETNVPHRDNVGYFGDGTDEAQLVYNFALPPLVLHSLQTGDATKLTGWAQSLRLPSDRVTFFNFLASHDGIGLNPARGILSEEEIAALVRRTETHGGFISGRNMPDGSEAPYEMNINYLDALSNPATEPPGLAARKFLTAQAIMLCLQGMPGIYFHSLLGSRGDRAGVAASGIKRRINREKLPRARLEADLADASSLRHRIFAGMCALLGLRRAHPAFAPGARQLVLDCGPRVFAVRRETADGRDRMVCVHNTSAEKISIRPAGFPDRPLTIEAWGHRWLPSA